MFAKFPIMLCSLIGCMGAAGGGCDLGDKERLQHTSNNLIISDVVQRLGQSIIAL